ncbi:hypothetical protein PoB_004040100 [Plakobranchus ocellatus]|uniref:Uncharacterized protein n=1 Tax=Plakobranchus ocellatus TaxID=259542 RepID=A0AAV4B050_9GAST|nr:hypothetical protein PoB_004040100 [Plakobranchus ocellatus]
MDSLNGISVETSPLLTGNAVKTYATGPQNSLAHTQVTVLDNGQVQADLSAKSTGTRQDADAASAFSLDRSTNKEDEDEGSPVDDVGVETDDESDVNFDVEEGEVDGLRLDSSDDDESECRSRSSPSPIAEIVLSIFFNIL